MNQDTNDSKDVKIKHPRSRRRKILYVIAGLVVLIAIATGIILTSYPNLVLDYAVAPKLKQLIVDKLGRRYSLEMKTITFSKNKDSLILTGVRITDNGKSADGSSDTSSENFGVATPLDRLTTDTVMIAGLDYWKLIMQKGLFAGSITVFSPKIYLRPGTLPKFEKGGDILPGFLPAVSSKTVKVENAEVFLSEKMPDPLSPKKDQPGGVMVKRASLEFRDFYLDESALKSTTQTFFCKSATFHAEDVSHIDSLGVTDINVAVVDGDLIDSSMTVSSIESRKPIEEVRKVAIKQVQFKGLDWFSALAGKGLHGRLLEVSAPQIYLQDVASIGSSGSNRHIAASDLIPLPSLLPDVTLENINVVNAEVYALLPETHTISSLKRIRMSLNKFRIDNSTPFTNISTFFSENAAYGIKGKSSLNTSLGILHLGEVKGNSKSAAISDIRLDPSIKGLTLVKLRSAEISGLDIWKLLMREGLFAASVKIREPKIYLDESVSPPLTSFDSVLTSDPLAMIREFKAYPLPILLPVANIGSITVSGGSVYGIHFLEDPKNTPGPGDSLTGLSITLKNFKLDQNSWIQKRGMLFSNAGSFQIGALTQQTRGAVYSYTEGGIRGDLRKRSLTIDSVVVHPLISEDSFGAAFEFRRDRIDFFAPKIEISGVDYQKLLLGSGLSADSVSLENWNMHLYGDKRRPEKIRKSRDFFPHELFQLIRMPVSLKSVAMHEGNIFFRESWPDTTEPGTITLNHINANIGAVSNDITPIGKIANTKIVGNLKIMNAGLVNFTIDYQLMNPRLVMDIRGNAGSMDASLFNFYLSKTEPFTLTGNVYGADFNIALRDSLMTGSLIPQYDSLDVTFFRWDRFPPGLVSLLANAVFMRSHNTTALDHPLHVGEISAILDSRVGLFWSLWLPIRNSIGSVVRIPEWVW